MVEGQENAAAEPFCYHLLTATQESTVTFYITVPPYIRVPRVPLYTGKPDVKNAVDSGVKGTFI